MNNLTCARGGWYAIYRDFDSYLARRVAVWRGVDGFVPSTKSGSGLVPAPDGGNGHTPSVVFVTYDWYGSARESEFHITRNMCREQWRKYREMDGLPTEPSAEIIKPKIAERA